MSKPAILTVDDDPMVSAAITRDLRDRYGGDYRVLGATSGADGLAVLERLALRDQSTALIVTAAVAQTQTCPETHYPCGSASCCPK